jgi:hypothetical protein
MILTWRCTSAEITQQTKAHRLLQSGEDPSICTRIGSQSLFGLDEVKLFIASHAAGPLLMVLRDGRSGFVVSIEPMADECFHNQPGIAEMLGGIFLKV